MHMIDLLVRAGDAMTHSNDLELLHAFKNFPVFMGCTDDAASDDKFFDMKIWISASSGLIQLNPLLPLDVLYPSAHGSGSVGASWAQHHAALARFIAEFKPKSVLEIGGAHGILAFNYQNVADIPWTILEPNPSPMAGCRAEYIKGFFSDDFMLSREVDTIVHSHVFEHLYDPVSFVKHQAEFLSIGNKLIFSVPNMRAMLERKFTNCLNFEHTILLTEDYIEYLLNSNGFEIVKTQYFRDDHSIFYAAIRTNYSSTCNLPDFLYGQNKALYQNYLNFHVDMVSKINYQIENTIDRSVFLFGAHVQSQYLIAFGFDLSKVVGILDNDTNKHGKRLYGTDKIVLNPSVLASCNEPIVVIRAGTFADEIIEQLKTINNSIVFVANDT